MFILFINPIVLFKTLLEYIHFIDTKYYLHLLSKSIYYNAIKLSIQNTPTNIYLKTYPDLES